jgi:hypothetical protein
MVLTATAGSRSDDALRILASWQARELVSEKDTHAPAEGAQ